MKKILLVDDEPMTLRVMRQALEKEGYKVDTAYDGTIALEKLADDPPDILITDIDMPRLSGKDLVQHIERTIPDRTYPIFITTSLTALEHRDWSRSVDNLVFIEKPISLRKLRAMIRDLDAVTSIDGAESGG